MSKEQIAKLKNEINLVKQGAESYKQGQLRFIKGLSDQKSNPTQNKDAKVRLASQIIREKETLKRYLDGYKRDIEAIKQRIARLK
jgi:hypothetical protein